MDYESVIIRLACIISFIALFISIIALIIKYYN